MSESKTILIVDSLEGDRHLLRGWLMEDRDQNYQILEAEITTQGLELWRSPSPDQKIDLIITDIDFPNRDSTYGLALLNAIREEIGCNRALGEHKLPILVTTRNKSAKVAVQAMRIGVFDYLDKDELTASALQKATYSLIEHLVFRELLEQSYKLENQIFQNLQAVSSELKTKLKQRTAELDSEEQRRLAIKASLEKEFIRNKILFTTSFDGIVILDSQGKIIEANQSFAKTLGYTDEEITNLSIYDIDVQLNRQEIETKIRRLKANQKHIFETLHKDKDGLILNIEVSASATEWENQVIVFCVCRDITQRKLDEAIQRQQNQQIRNLIENSPDVIARFEQDFRCSFMNSTIEKFRGEPPSHYIGHIIPDMPEPIAIAIKKVFTTGKPELTEFKYSSATGNKYFQTSLLPEFDASGNVISVMKISRDFTDQKLVENTLRKKIEREQIFNKFIRVIHILPSQCRITHKREKNS